MPPIIAIIATGQSSFRQVALPPRSHNDRLQLNEPFVVSAFVVLDQFVLFCNPLHNSPTWIYVNDAGLGNLPMRYTKSGKIYCETMQEDTPIIDWVNLGERLMKFFVPLGIVAYTDDQPEIPLILYRNGILHSTKAVAAYMSITAEIPFALFNVTL